MNEIQYKCIHYILNKDKTRCFPNNDILECPMIKYRLLTYSTCNESGTITIDWTTELIYKNTLVNHFIKL